MYNRTYNYHFYIITKELIWNKNDLEKIRVYIRKETSKIFIIFGDFLYYSWYFYTYIYLYK